MDMQGSVGRDKSEVGNRAVQELSEGGENDDSVPLTKEILTERLRVELRVESICEYVRAFTKIGRSRDACVKENVNGI